MGKEWYLNGVRRTDLKDFDIPFHTMIIDGVKPKNITAEPVIGIATLDNGQKITVRRHPCYNLFSKMD
jgi:hypothetical protein